MKRIDQYILESARQWGLSPLEARILFWTPIVGAVFFAAARLQVSVFRFMLSEDGPVEWAQFVCFVIGCLAAAGVTLRLRQSGMRWQAALFGLLAVALLFAAGEEISWGQRVLGFDTPQSLREINKQNELTLHNIGETLSVFKLVMMIGGLVAGVAYLVNRRLRLERYAAQAEFLFVPPFFLSSAFLFVFAYQAIRLIVPVLRESSFTITKYGEWSEFCLAFGLALFLWLNERRLRAASKSQEAQATEKNASQEVVAAQN